MKTSLRVAVESDIAEATRRVRQMAEDIGFDRAQACYVATAASELAANLFIHAYGGVFIAQALTSPNGIELLTMDDGPGIPDIEQSLQEGFSTAGGLGCGLPGVKRLMDSLEIESRMDQGTRVRSCKWL